jgi:hypothetical protein
MARDNAGMSRALAAFLAESELDHLATARDALGTPSPEDRETIARTLDAWADVQAVANLLMHPDLVDEARRVAALRRALDGGGHPYLALAATVGLQRVGRAQLEDEQRAELARALLDALERESRGPLPGRASVTLAALLGEGEAERAAALLDHPDRTVRHNVMVALVSALGPDAVGPFLAAAEERGTVSEAGGTFADLELASGPGAPLLTYIPNLRDT